MSNYKRLLLLILAIILTILLYPAYLTIKLHRRLDEASIVFMESVNTMIDKAIEASSSILKTLVNPMLPSVGAI